MLHLIEEHQHLARDLGKDDAVIGEAQPARSALAEHRAKGVLEALQSKADRRLLAREVPRRPTDVAGLGNLIERLQQIPIEVADQP
jgi:hypothetical protein